jgi:undecaprenyl pyrophosphate phosphatase UppP
MAFRADLASLLRDSWTQRNELRHVAGLRDSGRLVLAVVVATIPTGIIGPP